MSFSDCSVIIPVEITDAMIDSTTVAEDDYDEWSAKTWTVGDYCILTSVPVGESCTDEYLHKIYLCAEDTAAAGAFPPDHIVGDTDGNEKWTLVGPTNSRKMFDQTSLSETTDDDEIEIELTPGVWFNRIALFCDCATIDITIDDPVDGEVFSETISTVDLSVITDYYSFFFTEPPRKEVFVVDEIPMYSNATTTITFTDTGNTVSVGEVIVGLDHYIGKLQYGYSVSLQDYSVKGDDLALTGEITADNATLRIRLPANSMYRIKQLLAQYHATWLMWVGSPDRPETNIFGKYDSLVMTAQSFNYDYCSIKILEAS